jgi:hypothetical protein
MILNNNKFAMNSITLETMYILNILIVLYTHHFNVLLFMSCNLIMFCVRFQHSLKMSLWNFKHFKDNLEYYSSIIIEYFANCPLIRTLNSTTEKVKLYAFSSYITMNACGKLVYDWPINCFSC